MSGSTYKKEFKSTSESKSVVGECTFESRPLEIV